MNKSPIQKILFGSPGTGKSHKIKNVYAKEKLGIDSTSENYIATVFHPEYTYGDFMGKLMPFTEESEKVSYKFYSGHFLKALAQAYKNIILSYLEQEEEQKKAGDDYKKEIGKTNTKNFSTAESNEFDARKAAIERKKPKNVILVVDELNRGNSAAIFGTVFQLLDRESNGWSTYPITISDLEYKGLLKETSFEQKKTFDTAGKFASEMLSFNKKLIEKAEDWLKYQSCIFEEIAEPSLIEDRKIKIPPNLSIIATMNTSDNSIYFMDNAFKRRWDWEFIEIEEAKQNAAVQGWNINLYENTADHYNVLWVRFVDKLNAFIRSKYKVVRKIEDKQIGYRFINKATITEEDIKSKLMFFVWDSVFATDKKPLVELLGVDEKDLITFGEFSKKDNVIKFVAKIFNYNV